MGIGGWVWAHPSVLLLLASGALIPACFWLWLYYRQVYMEKDDTRVMIITFVWGMTAVALVLAINYLLKLFIGFDVVTFMNDANNEGRILLVITGYTLLGAFEEYAKFFIISRVTAKQVTFTRVVDGIEYAIAGALGFAFIENIAYFAVAAQDYVPNANEHLLALITNMTFIQIVIARNFGTMLVHTLFSGFLGYYYGKAKVLELAAEINEKKNLRQYLLATGVQSRVKRIKQLWQNRNFPLAHSVKVKRDELLAEGLLVAVVLHAIYNSLLHYELAYFIVPLVIGEFALIMYELHLTRNLRIYDLERAERNEIRRELKGIQVDKEDL